nr:hypothetical protein [Pandoravirus massiliensis]
MTTPKSDTSLSKAHCRRADRAAMCAQRTVRRGTLVGALAGAAGFCAADVASGFGTDSAVLAYVSALPVCVVLGGLGGTASAIATRFLVPRRRQRRAIGGWCLAATASAWLWWQTPSETDRPV